MAGIFISYRREDAAGHAGRLYDRLRERFGTDAVFMDVTAIEAGTDFVQAIERAVGSCDVLLAVIGHAWLSCTDAGGRPRLEDTDDFVRLEIAAALQRQVRLIPVLIDGATMPSAEVLPDELQPLVRRQAVELRNSRWDIDVQGLIATLEPTVSGSPAGRQRGTAKQQSGPFAKARRWVKGLSLKVTGASAAVFLALGLFLAYYFLLPPAELITTFALLNKSIREFVSPPPAELVATLDLQNESGSIRQLVPLPYGRLASASATGTIKVWNLSTLEERQTLDYGRDVKGLVPLPGPGERIVSVDNNDGTVSLWDLRTGKVARTLEKSEDQLGDDVIPLGEERFVIGTRGGVKIWNVATGRIEKMLKLDDDYPLIQKLALLRDGRLATGDHLGTVRIWNLTPSGNRLEALKGDRAGQYSIRVNDQFRVCFRWTGTDAEDVEIVDYH